MEDKYQNLIKLHKNYKEIFINDKYKTINKFVKFAEFNKTKISEKMDILNFIDKFYLEEKTNNETLNISRENRTVMLIKFCFLMDTLEDNNFKLDYIKNLMLKTIDYYSEKLILFNQELYNLSKI